MFDKKKRIKQIITIAVVLVLIIGGICVSRIRSVKSYNNKYNTATEQNQNNNDQSQSGQGLSSDQQGKGSQAGLNGQDQNNGSDANEQADQNSDLSDRDRANLNESSEQANAGNVSNSGDASTIDSGSAYDNSGNGSSNDGPDSNGLGNNASNDSGNNGSGDNDDQTEPSKRMVTCTISIRCDEAVAKKSSINNEGIRNAIPDDGVILSETTVTVEEGTSVLTVLMNATTRNNISVVNQSGTYVTAINNLGEKQVGMGSGWTYRVNGDMPKVAAPYYTVSDGDQILWKYVCN